MITGTIVSASSQLRFHIGEGVVMLTRRWIPARLVVLVMLCVPIAVIAQTPTLTSVAPASGPAVGGTSITLAGTNLSDGVCFPICQQAALIIGGVEVPFHAPNSTTITAVTPAHLPGTVDVVYYAPSHYGMATLPSAFTFVAPPSVPMFSRRVVILLGVVLVAVATLSLRVP